MVCHMKKQSNYVFLNCLKIWNCLSHEGEIEFEKRECQTPIKLSNQLCVDSIKETFYEIFLSENNFSWKPSEESKVDL